MPRLSIGIHLRSALSAALVVGTVVGIADGLATLSRNVYAPQFALFCLAAPIVLTVLFLGVVAVAMAIVDRMFRSPVEALPARLASELVGVVTFIWAALWLGAVAWHAREAGGGGLLFILILSPVLVCTLGAVAVTRMILRQIAPATLHRWIGRAAVGCTALNVLLGVWLGRIALSEGRRFLYDDVVGPIRRSDELSVLLVTIDTLRADRLSGFGDRAGLMPHLDRLAAEGVAFTTAITQSPWTMPAVASVFTGVTPSGHGAGQSLNAFDLLARSSISASVPTVTEILHDHGYLTQAIVTNPYLAMRYGFGRGFDRYENVTMESEAAVALRESLAFRVLSALWPQLIIGDIGENVSARAERWLERHHDEKFFLWLHYIDIHAPYGDPRSLGNKSFRGDVLWPSDLRTLISSDDIGDRFTAIARLRAGEIHLDAGQRQQLTRLYDAGVRYEDEQVGRVLDALDRLGLRAHTLVVVASDHGEEFWEHGGVEHGHTLFDELVHVPLIFRIPESPSGVRIPDVVRLMDVAPSILDLAGCADADRTTEGRSLRPLLHGEAEPPRTALSEALLFADEKRSVRTDRFKYIVSANGKEEVYDLLQDPNERRDVAGVDAVVKPLRQLYAQSDASKPPLAHLAAQPRMDGRTREALRSLGYVN